MDNGKQSQHASPDCCGKVNESFDATAMMEKFKDCCGEDIQKKFSECFSEMSTACCTPPTSEEK